MRVGGGEDLLEAVAVHVGHRDVLVVHAPAVARLAHAARGPARPHASVGLEDVDLLGVASARPRPRRLRAVRRSRGLRPPASAPRRSPKRGGRAPDDLQGPGRHEAVHVDLVAAAADDDLERAVPGQVGHGHAGPHALAVRGPRTAACPCVPLQRDHDRRSPRSPRAGRRRRGRPRRATSTSRSGRSS